MKKFLQILMVSILGVFLVAGSAMALPFNTRPTNAFDTTSLQSQINSNIVSGSLDVVDDQSSAAIWVKDEGKADAYLVSAVRGHQGFLGIYSYTTGAEYLLTTTNTDTSASFAISTSGVLYIDDGWVDNSFGSSFGFLWYNETQDNTFYTEDDKNQNGDFQALAYQLDDGFQIKTLASGVDVFTANGNNDWIIAWEDLVYETADRDFGDAIFVIEDISAVPEPATMLLLGAGLLGLAGLGRKKFFKKS